MRKWSFKKFHSQNRGIAMTETALLCFFLYVPVLMMVIIWGDMTLDKTRAHIAGAYLSFGGDESEVEYGDVFFPGANGSQDGTGSVRGVEAQLNREDGPFYSLPPTPSGDYTGDPPEFDLQYKLYSLAQGRMWVTTHLDASGEEVDPVYQIEQLQNEMGEYLDEEGIVEIELPEELPEIQPGEEIDLDTPGESRAYTAYVEVLTRMFNEGLTGGEVPRAEATARIATSFRSPFFRELEREYQSPRWEGETIGRGLPETFEMRFAPLEELPSQWADDESFHTGYAYLRKPAASPDGDTLLHQLTEAGAAETQSLFHTMKDGTDVNPDEMWRLQALSQDPYPAHGDFLEPGDPR